MLVAPLADGEDQHGEHGGETDHEHHRGEEVGDQGDADRHRPPAHLGGLGAGAVDLHEDGDRCAECGGHPHQGQRPLDGREPGGTHGEGGRQQRDDDREGEQGVHAPLRSVGAVG